MMLIPIVFSATVAGLLLAPYFHISVAILLSVLVPGVVCLALFFRFPSVRNTVLFLLFFLLANWRYPLQFPNDQFIETITGQKKVSVVAELSSLVHRAGGRSQLDLFLESYVAEGVEESISERVKVRLYVDDEVIGLLPGDRLKFATRFRLARLFGTPGEFHWPRYLASQGVAATGWLKSADQLNPVGHVWRFSRGLMHWKEGISQRLSASGPPLQSALVRALLLGESRQLPDRVRETFSRAGISHLFAISGLHLGLIGMFGYRLLLFVYRRIPWLLNWQPSQRVLPLCLLPLLLIYLFLTGDAVSTRRALGIAALAAVFWVWRYSVAPHRVLLFIATVFLLLHPLLLWQAGWQLSFAGATGILLWKPLWHEQFQNLRKLYRRPLSLLLVTTAATLATLPFLLLNFHLFATVGLIANLIAVPIVTLLALPVGLCGLLFSWTSWFADLSFQCCGLLLYWLLKGAEVLLSFPGAGGESLFLSDGQLLAVFLFVVPLLLAPQLRNKQAFLIAGTGWLVGLSALFLPLNPSAEATMYLFSVGQGESMLLTNNKQQAILIDGGGLYSDRYDVGRRLLAPALGKLGVGKLDAVFLTHDHPDHRKGLVYVLREFKVGAFWSALAEDDLHSSIRDVLVERAIPAKTVPEGWSHFGHWQDGDLSLYFSPDKKSKNNSSIVMRLQQGGTGLLLTGDLEKKGVQRLLRSEPLGTIGLLKLPHHGSKYSAAERLVDYFQPEAALVSAGYKNRYRLPSAKLVEHLKQQSVPLYRTDLMGTIRARLIRGEWEIDHWDRGVFR